MNIKKLIVLVTVSFRDSGPWKCETQEIYNIGTRVMLMYLYIHALMPIIPTIYSRMRFVGYTHLILCYLCLTRLFFREIVSRDRDCDGMLSGVFIFIFCLC